MVELIFWILSGLVVYTYFGYPILNYIQGRLFPIQFEKDPDYRPSMTFLISVHNEERVLREKLSNTLALDYPRNQIKILVVDDASTDETVSIAHSFEDVNVYQTAERRGKSYAINRALENETSDVIVFSDANVMYDSQTLKAFAQVFADDRVGCVCGDLRYRITQSSAGKGEGMYWKYERWIRRYEGMRGALISPNGTVFAVRRNLIKLLPERSANDFESAEQVAEQGKYIVFEPEAKAWENTCVTMGEEFQRKVRIISRCASTAFSRIFRMKTTRLFRMVSHKVLRWTIPLIMIGMAFCLGVLVYRGVEWAVYISALPAVFAGLAFLGWMSDKLGWTKLRDRGVLYVPYYFVVVNFASLWGLILFATRQQRAVWDSPASTRIPHSS